MSSRAIVISILFLFLTSGLKAQISDFQVWSELEASAKLAKGTNLLLEQEVRFNNNGRAFDKSISAVGLAYKINKMWRVRGFYRYDYGFDIETQNQQEHKAIADLIFRKNMSKRLRLSLRSRYQISFEGYTGSVYGNTPIQYWRNKLSLKYNVPKIPLNLSAHAECYFTLNNPVGNEIDKYRLTFGADYRFIDNMVAKVSYRYQSRRSNYRKPVDLNILALGLEYDF